MSHRGHRWSSEQRRKNSRSSEFYIEDRVVRHARELGLLALKTGLAGTPDCFFSNGQKMCFVEFKTKRGNLAPHQATTIKKIEDFGMKAVVIRSTVEGYRFLERFFA